MGSVQVEIFGHTYTIKADTDQDYIRELAAFVDAKMKSIQKGTGTAEPLRVAILTALTISDELYKARKGQADVEEAAETVAKRLLEMTEHAE